MQIGKYQLIHKLATGGMAEVFLAKAAGPMGFEKLLVVKRILPHLATEPTFVEMFLSEARLAAQLNHPNIVQIFDFGEAEGTYFIAMEYIDGPNLREIVKRANGVCLALPLVFCARIIASACEGLAFAHDFRDPATRLPMNVIHRDISPDNLLLSRQGAVKVVDFGIAKAAGMSPHTQTGVLKGKLAYMSPEQLRNEPLDRRADVYALGVVLYELLTGFKPFMATSEAGMVQAILFEMQVPVTQRRPDVPDTLQRILGRALAKEREKRYPDCASFQAELEEFIMSMAKTMGASQIAQLVCMMTASLDNPTPVSQTIGSGRSNPRFSLSQAPLPLLPPLEPAAASPERPPVGLSPAGAVRNPQGGEMELTSAARPSRLLPRDRGRSPESASPPPEPPAEPAPLKLSRPPEKDMVWAARVGILLVLAGGGYLSQRSSFWQRGAQPSSPPAEVSPSAEPGSAPANTIAEESHAAQSAGGLSTPGARAGSSMDAGVEAPLALVAAQTGSSTVTPPAIVRPMPQMTGQGTLELRVVPESMFWLGRFQMGSTNKPPFALDAGKYTLRVVNAQLKKEETREIMVVAGKPTRIEINLLK